MNSKQRAYLRGEANALEAIFQIGKEGLSDVQITEIGFALHKRELIKLGILETCPVTAREAAVEIASRLKAEVVQVIGRKFVLYKKNHDIQRYGV